MGTNYYLHSKPCPHCGRADEPFHIGKSSAGWYFSLHVTDEIKSLEDWQKRWNDPETTILDEYGRSLTVGEMEDVIMKRKWNRPEPLPRTWYRENNAEPGLYGLARPIVDGRHCVEIGPGTWALITGEFS